MEATERLHGPNHSTAGLRDMLLDGGVSAFEQLVREQQEEGLYLEFKTLVGTSAGSLTKEDRRLVAKAICGLSNAEGGLLITGIATKKVDGLDTACALQPLADVAALRNRLASAIPEMLNPVPSAIAVDAIPADQAGSGFLIVQVPRSPAAPHMSIPHHQYFRRRADSTTVMEHGEVRDQMFAAREADLDLLLHARIASYAGLHVGLHLVIALRNVGRAAAVAPYLRISGAAPSVPTDSLDAVAYRFGADQAAGFYTNASTILHVGDTLNFAALKTGITFRTTVTTSVKAATSRLAASRDPDDFFIADAPMSHPLGRPAEVLPEFDCFWGAMNMAARARAVRPTKLELFDIFSDRLRALD